jgi:hypothetical protein
MISGKSSLAGAGHKDETPGIAGGRANYSLNHVFLLVFKQKMGIKINFKKILFFLDSSLLPR